MIPPHDGNGGITSRPKFDSLPRIKTDAHESDR